MTERLVIAGVPRSGKTTLSGTMENVRHTDDLIAEIPEWSAQSAAVVEWFREPGPWVIEGVNTTRALRKWFQSESTTPCDRVIWMPTPRETLTRGQLNMAKGLITIWGEIEQRLQDLGIQIEKR